MAEFRDIGSRTIRVRYVVAAGVAAAALVIMVGLLAGLLGRNPPCPDAGRTTSAPNGTQPPSTRGPTTTPDPSKPWLAMRLPDSLAPRRYRVRLHPRLGNESRQGFSGEVDIHLSVRRPTKYILVHVKFLSVTATQVLAQDSSQLPVVRTFNYTENQFWVIELERELESNSQPVVKLAFQGFYFGIVGLYQSTYEEGGVQKFLATTKFEPTDARKAFPCLDEPQLKANFTVELVHQHKYHALSNMPAASRQNRTEDGLVLTTFQETPKMSTYLFCILISEFSSLNLTTSTGSPFRTWAPTSLVQQTDYALKSGARIQDFFGTWLNYSYDRQFPKQDMAAIPDFPSGAMEHWGLITYRDTSLLFNSSDSSAANQQRVVTIVAHELAHMWFGNLVTMVWWNDLWLNEGFASYFADIGASQIEPSWELREQGIVTTYNSAFGADDAVTSHPIIVDVATPAEITQIFDTITYSKGQAVLTQLADFMGMGAFQQGLQDYLKRNEFGVATTVQLYESLQRFTALNVTEFMDRWTRQMGFPLVTVSNVGPDPNVIQLSQSWYLRQPDTRPEAPESPYGYQWIIKLNYQDNGTIRTHMLSQTQDKLLVSNSPATPPIKFNLGQRGFFRVNYHPVWWVRFATSLQSNVESYSAVDRAGLIGDAFAVALSNQLNYGVVVNLLSYLTNETHYLPWYTANSGLNVITRQLERRPTFGRWAAFGQRIISGAYSAIGWGPQSDHLRRLLQPTVLTLACRFGHPDCLTQARTQFQSWMSGKSVPAELRPIVYTYGLMATDTQESWNFVWEQYRRSGLATERERLLRALAMTKNSWLVSQLLEYSRDRSLVRGQDFVTLIGYIGANPNALEIVWNWCRVNWKSLLDEFGREDRRLGAMVPGFAQQFNDQFHLDEYQSFISSTEPGAGQNARMSALSTIKSNIKWIQDNEQELMNALK